MIKHYTASQTLSGVPALEAKIERQALAIKTLELMHNIEDIDRIRRLEAGLRYVIEDDSTIAHVQNVCTTVLNSQIGDDSVA